MNRCSVYRVLRRYSVYSVLLYRIWRPELAQTDPSRPARLRKVAHRGADLGRPTFPFRGKHSQRRSAGAANATSRAECRYSRSAAGSVRSIERQFVPGRSAGTAARSAASAADAAAVQGSCIICTEYYTRPGAGSSLCNAPYVLRTYAPLREPILHPPQRPHTTLLAPTEQMAVLAGRAAGTSQPTGRSRASAVVHSCFGTPFLAIFPLPIAPYM